jgi:hypothetical protein
MKKILSYSLVVIMTFAFVSCDKDFDEINTNQYAATSIDPVFQLNNAVINLAFPTGTLNYEIGVVQQIISPNGGVLAGANFNQDNRALGGPIWQAYYRNVVRNTNDVIVATKANTARANLYNMARILQAYALMVLTDTYGDVPYTQAGKGFTDQAFYPKYEAQQAIYTDIIKEFTEASAALNAATPTEAGEILYGGNIAQWKKFGYSLLLRAGMRLSKVDPAKAQSTVQAAFNGGVILTNADNAFMRHDANYLNPVSNTLNSTEAANYYLTKPFVDYLKNTNDPRLSSIAIRYVGAKSGPEQTVASGNTTAAVQIGMPMGKDNGTVVTAAAADGLASFYEYSQADRRRVTKPTAPNFFVTAAQTNLLLAEARNRGWITANTDQFYYEAGVTAHMLQMASYDAASAIPAASISAYLAANPFLPATALEQINTQYWIASFLNGPEAFANFRRSGFPALTPNPYPGDIPAGTFIRRITYPTSELSVNSTNVNEAISRMGADKLSTRVWWDK